MRQNVICTGMDDICLICEIGDSLENADFCEYDSKRTEEECPGFICNEQCRSCPESCEFYQK